MTNNPSAPQKTSSGEGSSNRPYYFPNNSDSAHDGRATVPVTCPQRRPRTKFLTMSHLILTPDWRVKMEHNWDQPTVVNPVNSTTQKALTRATQGADQLLPPENRPRYHRVPSTGFTGSESSFALLTLGSAKAHNSSHDRLAPEPVMRNKQLQIERLRPLRPSNLFNKPASNNMLSANTVKDRNSPAPLIIVTPHAGVLLLLI
jgi:hypothetical protein